MTRCAECGTPVNITPFKTGDIIECYECGIDLEIEGNKTLALQLGPSEE